MHPSTTSWSDLIDALIAERARTAALFDAYVAARAEFDRYMSEITEAPAV